MLTGLQAMAADADADAQTRKVARLKDMQSALSPGKTRELDGMDVQVPRDSAAPPPSPQAKGPKPKEIERAGEEKGAVT